MHVSKSGASLHEGRAGAALQHAQTLAGAISTPSLAKVGPNATCRLTCSIQRCMNPVGPLGTHLVLMVAGARNLAFMQMRFQQGSSSSPLLTCLLQSFPDCVPARPVVPPTSHPPFAFRNHFLVTCWPATLSRMSGMILALCRDALHSVGSNGFGQFCANSRALQVAPCAQRWRRRQQAIAAAASSTGRPCVACRADDEHQPGICCCNSGLRCPRCTGDQAPGWLGWEEETHLAAEPPLGT